MGVVDSNVIYDDGRVVLDDDALTLRRYYFPLGTSRRIRYGEIQGVRARPMGWLTGKGRGWGTARPDYWLPLDLSRWRRSTLLVLDLGRRVKPAFSPAEPDVVLRLLSQRTHRDPGPDGDGTP